MFEKSSSSDDEGLVKNASTDKMLQLVKVKDENSISMNTTNSIQAPKKKTFAKIVRKIPIKDCLKLLSQITIGSLCLILISMLTTLSDKLKQTEKNFLFPKLEKLIFYETLTSEKIHNIFYIFQLFNNKEFIGGFCCVLYSIFHPFIGLKLIFGLSISHYVLMLLKIFYHSERPSWYNWEGNKEDSSFKDDIIECDATYSNPSNRIFIFIFFAFYSLFAYKNFYKPKENLNCIFKLLYFLIITFVLIIECFLLLIYKLHFLYEIAYSASLSLTLVFVLIELDASYQMKIFRLTKNLFKIRKHVIKSFLFCIFLVLIGFSFYNFSVSTDNLYTVEPKIFINDSCSQQQKDEISMKNTIFEISFIFTIMGGIWGTTFALQRNSGRWWYLPSSFFVDNDDELNNLLVNNFFGCNEFFIFLIKGIFTSGIYFLIWFCFYIIPYVSYEFNFILKCFQYFISFFICMGVLPVFFGYFNLNKGRTEVFENMGQTGVIKIINSQNLFKPSILVECFDKSNFSLMTRNQQISYLRDTINSFKKNQTSINANEDD